MHLQSSESEDGSSERASSSRSSGGQGAPKHVQERLPANFEVQPSWLPARAAHRSLTSAACALPVPVCALKGSARAFTACLMEAWCSGGSCAAGELPQGGSEERSAGEPGSLAGPLPLRPSVDMGAETQLITPPASPAGRQSQPSPQQAPAATGPPASPPAEPGGGESSGPGASQQQQQPLPRVTRRATGRRRRA